MMRFARSLLLCALLAGIHASAGACPSCYGASDSPLAQGMNNAILVMLAIIGFVLGLFVFFFLMLRRRSQIFNDQPSDKAFVTDKGTLRWNIF
jgi:heme/copper-type cytochrome/quinol oxidase subunit 2